MINEGCKEEHESNILKQKEWLSQKHHLRKQAKLFNNSQLVFAFHKKRKPHHQTLSATPKNNKIQKSNKSITLGINSNMNYQMFNVVPNSDSDKKTQFLKKKSLKILKCPQKNKQYKSLSLIKKTQLSEPQIKLSRTQILKSILMQYDRNIENKIYLKKGPQQQQKESPSFFTQLGDSTSKSKINITSKSIESSPFSDSNTYRKADGKNQRYKITLNQEQIQQIVRKSLKEIDREKQKQKVETSKSLISFSKKAIYLKKMKKVQTSLDTF